MPKIWLLHDEQPEVPVRRISRQRKTGVVQNKRAALGVMRWL